MAKILTMPSLSPSMEQGLLESWEKKVGDFIESGEVLAHIETDKAVVEYEILDDGYLRHFFLNAGDSATVGQPIAILAETDSEDISQLVQSGQVQEAPGATPSIQPEEDVQARAATSETDKVSPPAPAVERPKPVADTGDRVKASPLARKMASERNIDLSQVRGSGPQGRIVKEDLEKFQQRGIPASKPESKASPAAASKPAAPTASAAASSPAAAPEQEILEADGNYESIPLSGMRRAIATRLVESTQTIPHFYLTVKVGVDALLESRKALNAVAEVKISVNDMIIKACGTALQKHPNINTRFTADALLQFEHAHVGFAVATPEGLITPIVRYVDQKGLGQIAKETKDMAGRAREKRLSIEEFTGGTFGTSNLGMFGIDQFTAIINPPQSCNLAISKAADELQMHDGKVVTTKQMTLTLSCDHRVVDGASGAAFLQTLKQTLENPLALVL